MFFGSRLFVVLGVLGYALAIVLRDGYAGGILLLAALVVVIVNGFLSLAKLTDVRRRPVAFTVAGGKFVARLAFSQGAMVMFFFVMLGVFTSAALQSFDDPESSTAVFARFQLVLTAVLSLLTIVLAVLAWVMASPGVRLTPEGIMTRTLWDRRGIPWEALAHGGPLRPGPKEAGIRLVFARPELVRRGRLRLPGQGDIITTQLDVHPSLVADAIRWYVDNPGDRAAIGTQAEHDRLVAAVGATSYQQSAPMEQPPSVRTAIRLGYVGVVFGLLTAILDVALAFGFEDRLKAHAVAVGEQEMREFGGEPVDWESSVLFNQAWYVGVLVFAMLTALVALMSIQALKRGNVTGRIGLIAVSAVAGLWALMPCLDIAYDPPPGLGALLLTVTAVKRLGYVGLGVATLILLLTPSAQVFTQPTEMRTA